ncbi:MAG TPA: sulfate adenylyltransferase subunit CysD [Candidatus Baltobacteraceae bacterium]|nr:sulfate adenylyltransferase subunit CysD [Candidatus Baltobacteraceae bacterium]
MVQAERPAATESYSLSVIRRLEAESIHILREVAAECERPVMLYSVGKDSSTMVRLALKAFHPGKIPFPLLHVDTSMKFPQMYDFRDRFCREIGAELRVYRHEEALQANANPWDLGTVKCCGLLKTQALLNALKLGNYDGVMGGARREEERSRAKERIYSFRDEHGQWDPKNQRPEIWSLYNGRVNPGESIRIFPLSNWTELDIWHYIEIEKIPVVPLYFAEEREVVVRGRLLIPMGPATHLLPGERPQRVMCRYRTLGCYPCTGAVHSTAHTVSDIIAELKEAKYSERITRIIDHDQDGSMEQKKREGYF